MLRKQGTVFTSFKRTLSPAPNNQYSVSLQLPSPLSRFASEKYNGATTCPNTSICASEKWAIPHHRTNYLLRSTYNVPVLLNFYRLTRVVSQFLFCSCTECNQPKTALFYTFHVSIHRLDIAACI